ncbi:MAG: hypothetical protein JWR19_3345 [Pedosphaera sp.]|nr:hypothetical protein [Pedosphaera sp.]
MKNCNRLPLLRVGLLLISCGQLMMPLSARAAGPAVANPIMFVTQVPVPNEVNAAASNVVVSVASALGNHLADGGHAPRGGGLYMYYPDGTWTNLTKLAGYGLTNLIAVRQPAVHWSGKKAIFSMLEQGPLSISDTNVFFWQMYEITNLNEGSIPSITKVANQPTNYNNISPIYGTDERIIFTTDRPRDGSPHLYPQLDEYNDFPTVTGLWSLETNTGDLFLINHTPSGAFTPIIDSFGRLVFTRWDHLVQDSHATDDRLGLSTNGTFNFVSEAANSPYDLSNRVENFPEPRNFDHTNLAALKLNGNSFNFFFPWQITEDGMGEEIINHLGRHEISLQIPNSFTNDNNLINLVNATTNRLHNANSNFFNDIFQMREDPLHAGIYYGVDAPDFGGHASGQIITLTGPLGMNADSNYITYITPKINGLPNPLGSYRNPVPMSDGTLIAAHSTATGAATNIGTAAFPKTAFDFRLMTLTNAGVYLGTNRFLTTGITNGSTNFSGGIAIVYTNALWELDPVEVRLYPKPANRFVSPIAAVEQQVFATEGVDIGTMQAYLRANNLALIVSRNVTTRDHADKQQPFNLHIAGTTNQTVVTNAVTGIVGKIYDISHIQFLQADQLRGLTMNLGTNPIPGRRVLANPLHEPVADNLPLTNGPTGSVKLGDDGSMAAFVPARRAMTWHLIDQNTNSIVKERYWVTFAPGEIRTCTSCHGINEMDQAGHTAPTNSPQALTALLRYWKAKYTPQVVLTNDTSTNYLAISFNHLLAATNLTQTVEVSDDLMNWTAGSTYTAAGNVPNTAITTEMSRSGTNTENIVVRDNAPLGTVPARFMRVRVSSP